MDFLRHIWVKLQKDVKNPPKIEWRLVHKVNQVEHLHVLHIVNKELHFACANYHRLQEHTAVDELFHFVYSLLFSMRHKNFLQNLSDHSSDVLCVQICELDHTRLKIFMVLGGLKRFFGKTLHNLFDDGTCILRHLDT